jgi:hypothetical protein
LSLPEFDSLTVQTEPIRYSDYAIPDPTKISTECRSEGIEKEVAVTDFELRLSGRSEGSNEKLQV